MKKHFIVIVCLMALATIGLTSCGRYPETSISLHSPEYRLIGSWKLQHTYLNGIEVDTTEYHAHMPGTYYYFYADHILNVLVSHNGELRQSTFSTWILQDKNRNLAIDFTILGRRYTYIAAIQKLTRKDLTYEYDDTEGNHWRLEFSSMSSF